MKRILMISGPALGHVARLSLVAKALKSRGDIIIDFVVADRCQHTALAETAGCHVHLLPIHETDWKMPAQPFALQLEALIQKLAPDVIVQDCNPLRWLAATDFPNCPRVVITNAFLTGHAAQKTHQVTDFETKKSRLNELRAGRGLPPLNTAYDLYDGDLILLADPEPIASQFSPWPDTVEICGPLCLEAAGDLLSDLDDLSDLILFSMGSTGGLKPYLDFARRIKTSTNFGPTVYVGSQANAARETGAFDLCFDWLPLSPVLSKSALVVTHGGTGSTYLALSQSVPVLVSPTHVNHRLLGEGLADIGVGGLIEDILDMKQLTAFRSKLAEYGSAFDHRAAPDAHATAILDLL